MKNIRKGMRVSVKKSIDPYLDPGRYRGVCGTVIRKSKRYKDQWYVKMDSRKISKAGTKPKSGDTILWHKEDLVRK